MFLIYVFMIRTENLYFITHIILNSSYSCFRCISCFTLARWNSVILHYFVNRTSALELFNEILDENKHTELTFRFEFPLKYKTQFGYGPMHIYTIILWHAYIKIYLKLLNIKICCFFIWLIQPLIQIFY